MTETPTIVWFRQDLRLADQAALVAAASQGPVVPLYVLDDDTPGEWAIGGRSGGGCIIAWPASMRRSKDAGRG